VKAKSKNITTPSLGENKIFEEATKGKTIEEVME
jgi:hypothetical protein